MATSDSALRTISPLSMIAATAKLRDALDDVRRGNDDTALDKIREEIEEAYPLGEVESGGGLSTMLSLGLARRNAMLERCRMPPEKLTSCLLRPRGWFGGGEGRRFSCVLARR